MSNENDDQITIKIKQSSNNVISNVTISKSEKVVELKKAITDITGIDAIKQNLVYKGRILFDDKVLSDYNLENDHTIILVEKAGNSSTVQDPNKVLNMPMQTGLGIPGQINTDLLRQPLNTNLGNVDLEGMANLMNNPEVRQNMNAMLSDPSVINAMLENPSIKPMLDANPYLRNMMSNPQFLQTMMDPTFLQNMSTMMNNRNTTTNTNTNTNTNMNTNNMNPFMNMNMMNMMNNPFLMGTMSNQNTYMGNPPQTNTDPKEKFKDQNQKLIDMGFSDEAANIQALVKTHGNVDAAVERLLNNLK
jgi:ubiquilin